MTPAPRESADSTTPATAALFAFAGFLALDLAALLWYGLRDWPEPWLRILGEQNTITWLSSQQLGLCSWLCLTVAWLRWRNGQDRRPCSAWLATALAFFALAADETFAFHERIDLPFRLPFQAAGEGVLLLAGLAFAGVCSLRMLPALWRFRPPLVWLCLAVGVGFLSQVLDGGGQLLQAAYFWQKMAEVGEELGELLATAAFIASLSALAVGELDALATDRSVWTRFSS